MNSNEFLWRLIADRNSSINSSSSENKKPETLRSRKKTIVSPRDHPLCRNENVDRGDPDDSQEIWRRVADIALEQMIWQFLGHVLLLRAKNGQPNSLEKAKGEGTQASIPHTSMFTATPMKDSLDGCNACNSEVFLSQCSSGPFSGTVEQTVAPISMQTGSVSGPPLRILQRQEERMERERRRKMARENRYKGCITSLDNELPLSPTRPLFSSAIPLSQGLRHLRHLSSVLLRQWEHLYPSAVRAMVGKQAYSSTATSATPDTVYMPFQRTSCPHLPSVAAVRTLDEMSEGITRSAPEYVPFLPYVPSALTPALLDGWTTAGLPIAPRNFLDLDDTGFSYSNEGSIADQPSHPKAKVPLNSSPVNFLAPSQSMEEERIITRDADALASRAMSQWFPSSTDLTRPGMSAGAPREANTEDKPTYLSNDHYAKTMHQWQDPQPHHSENAFQNFDFQKFGITFDETMIELFGTLVLQRVFYASGKDTISHFSAKRIWKWMLAPVSSCTTALKECVATFQDCPSSDTDAEEMPVSSEEDSPDIEYSEDEESEEELTRKAEEKEADAVSPPYNMVQQLLPSHYRSEEGIAERMIHFTLQYEVLLQHDASVAIPFCVPGSIGSNSSQNQEGLNVPEGHTAGRKAEEEEISVNTTQRTNENDSHLGRHSSPFSTASLPPPSVDIVRAVMQSQELARLLQRLLCEEVFPRLVKLILPLASLTFALRTSPALIGISAVKAQSHVYKDFIASIPSSPLQRWYKFLLPLRCCREFSSINKHHQHRANETKSTESIPHTAAHFRVSPVGTNFKDYSRARVPSDATTVANECFIGSRACGMEEVQEAVQQLWKKRRLEAVQPLTPRQFAPFSSPHITPCADSGACAADGGDGLGRLDEGQPSKSLVTDGLRKGQKDKVNGTTSLRIGSPVDPHGASCFTSSNARWFWPFPPLWKALTDKHPVEAVSKTQFCPAHYSENDHHDKIKSEKFVTPHPRELFVCFHSGAEDSTTSTGASSKRKYGSLTCGLPCKDDALAFWSFVRGLTKSAEIISMENVTAALQDADKTESKISLRQNLNNLKTNRENSRSKSSSEYKKAIPISAAEEDQDMKYCAFFCYLVEQKVRQLCEHFKASSSVSCLGVQTGSPLKIVNHCANDRLQSISKQLINRFETTTNEAATSVGVNGRRKKVDWLKLKISKFVGSTIPKEEPSASILLRNKEESGYLETKTESGSPVVRSHEFYFGSSTCKEKLRCPNTNHDSDLALGRRALPLPFLNTGGNSTQSISPVTPSPHHFLTAWNSQVDEVKDTFSDVLLPPLGSIVYWDGRTSIGQDRGCNMDKDGAPSLSTDIALHSADNQKSCTASPNASMALDVSECSRPSSSAWNEIGTVLSCISTVLDTRTLVDESGWRYGRNRVALAGSTYIGYVLPSTPPPTGAVANATNIPPHAATSSRIELPFSVSLSSTLAEVPPHNTAEAALSESSGFSAVSAPDTHPLHIMSSGERISVEGLFFHEPRLLYTRDGETYAMETYAMETYPIDEKELC